jgi:hypothetical protein
MHEFEYSAKLTQSLLACGLTPDQVEKTAGEKTLWFLFEKGDGPKNGFWDFNKKLENGADFIGVTKEQYRNAALRQHPLFYLSPLTVNANIENAAKLLGISKEQYTKAALRQPVLFTMDPETVNANIEGAAALFGLPKEIYIEKAALKQPTLFTMSPETAYANNKRAAEYLGVSHSRYIEASLKNPALFYQNPERIKSNASNTAALLGISRERYIEAALKQPHILSMAPKTLLKHYMAVAVAHENGNIVSDNILDDVLKCPTALTYSEKNTMLRTFHASMLEKRLSLGNFFKQKDKKTIEDEVVTYLTKEFEAGVSGVAEQVNYLHERGILSHLPPIFELQAVPA